MNNEEVKKLNEFLVKQVYQFYQENKDSFSPSEFKELSDAIYSNFDKKIKDIKKEKIDSKDFKEFCSKFIEDTLKENGYDIEYEDAEEVEEVEKVGKVGKVEEVEVQEEQDLNKNATQAGIDTEVADAKEEIEATNDEIVEQQDQNQKKEDQNEQIQNQGQKVETKEFEESTSKDKEKIEKKSQDINKNSKVNLGKDDPRNFARFSKAYSDKLNGLSDKRPEYLNAEAITTTEQTKGDLEKFCENAVLLAQLVKTQNPVAVFQGKPIRLTEKNMSKDKLLEEFEIKLGLNKDNSKSEDGQIIGETGIDDKSPDVNKAEKEADEKGNEYFDSDGDPQNSSFTAEQNAELDEIYQIAKMNRVNTSGLKVPNNMKGMTKAEMILAIAKENNLDPKHLSEEGQEIPEGDELRDPTYMEVAKEMVEDAAAIGSVVAATAGVAGAIAVANDIKNGHQGVLKAHTDEMVNKNTRTLGNTAKTFELQANKELNPVKENPNKEDKNNEDPYPSVPSERG